MQIYTLIFSNNADCKFKIGSDYISEQIDINISDYNMEVFVSPLLNNGNQNNVVNIKIKLKTLINIIKCIFNNKSIVYFLDSQSIKENIIGELTNNILNKIKDQINSQYIKIYLYNIHKIYYDNFSEKIIFKYIFKYIFSNNEINTNNLYDNYKIIISTIRLFNYIISYKTLCNIVNKKLNKNNIDILTILNNDIYFTHNNNNNIDIKIIVEELYDIEFTTKNEIKYFFVNLI